MKWHTASGQQPADQVELEINPAASRQARQRGRRPGDRQEHDRETVLEHIGYGHADAVHRDGRLGRQLIAEPFRGTDPDPPGGTFFIDAHDLADGVDVPLHQVTIKRVSGRQRHLDVDRAALGQRIERRPAPGLLRDGRPERTGSCLLHGQPHASHAHRPASLTRRAA
jgi:hypothetical protein